MTDHNINNIIINNDNENKKVTYFGSERIDYNLNIIPLFNSSIVLKKIDDNNRNLSLVSNEDKLIVKIVSINDRLSLITNSIKNLQLTQSNEMIKNNKFNYFYNLLIRKNEFYKLRFELINLILRIKILIGVFYYLNNSDLSKSKLKRIKVARLLRKLLRKENNKKNTLFIPKHLITTFKKVEHSTVSILKNQYKWNKKGIVGNQFKPLRRKLILNKIYPEYNFRFNNQTYKNLNLLQKDYLNNTGNEIKKIQNLQQIELNNLLIKLNIIQSNIDNLIIKFNVLIEIFNFKKIYNNLNSAEILNINNNQNSLNNNLETNISNLSLIEFYDLLEDKQIIENNSKIENYIFNLIPYIYNINNDSNKNIFNFNLNNKFNFVTTLPLNNTNILEKEINTNKENKIKIEETMKTIFDKYTLSSSNEWIMENTLLKSNNQFNSLEFNNELESDNINKINTLKRKNYLNEMVNAFSKEDNLNKINLLTEEKDLYNTNKNFDNLNNTINNSSKGLNNISPVNVYYYPLNKYSEFQRGFILQKLLNKSLNNDNTKLELETKSEYSNWLKINKRPIINQYLKAMSKYNLRKTGTFIYFTNIFSYNFINNNNKIIKNIYKLLSFVFKSMYSLISKPVFSITPNKVIIHLFYFLLIPNILKKKLSSKSINNKASNLKVKKLKLNRKRTLNNLPVIKKQLFKLLNSNYKNNNSLTINKINQFKSKNNNFNLINFLTLNIKPLHNKIIDIKIKNNIIKIKSLIIKINLIINLIFKNYSQISNNTIKRTLKLKLVELYRIKNRLFKIYSNYIISNQVNLEFNNNNIEVNNNLELNNKINDNYNTILISNYKKYYNKNINENTFLNNNSIFKTRKYNIFFKNHIIDNLNINKIFSSNESDNSNLLLNSTLSLSEDTNLVINDNNKNRNLLNFKKNLLNKKKHFTKEREKWKLFRNKKKFNSLNLSKRIKLIKLYNFSLINLYPKKFESLCNILNYCFNKNVVIDLTRIHYPYNDANILVNMLAIMIRKISFRRITRKLFKKTIIKNVKKLFYFNNYNLLPSFLTGMKIKLGGKVLNFRSKSRNTVKIAEKGSSSIGKVNYTDFARYTNKHKRGSFSISISNSQNFY